MAITKHERMVVEAAYQCYPTTPRRLALHAQFGAEVGPGMDWVHTNCDDQPTPDKPDGWVEVIGPNGTPGPNLESKPEVSCGNGTDAS